MTTMRTVTLLTCALAIAACGPSEPRFGIITVSATAPRASLTGHTSPTGAPAIELSPGCPGFVDPGVPEHVVRLEDASAVTITARSPRGPLAIVVIGPGEVRCDSDLGSGHAPHASINQPGEYVVHVGALEAAADLPYELTVAPTVAAAESRTAVSPTAETLTARITCAGGTYIRALARDLARAVGSAGHCVALRRTRIGAFGIADAIPALELAERAQAALRSPVDGLDPSLTRESIDADACSAIAHGRAVPARSPGARAALLGPEGALVAIAERQGDLWHPNVVLAHA